MINNGQLIKNFYLAFANGDAEGMIACYHEKITFEDPAFGKLQGEDAKNMWRMLVERSKGQIKITCTNIEANDKTGSAYWEAHYTFGQTGRKVLNKIHASYEFEGGKIIKHTDRFSMWNWSRQALGLSGFLLGWSSFMKKKIQERSRALLRTYTDRK